MEPEVTHFGMLDMQVCVPREWTNEQAERFGEKEYPCGTTKGWTVRPQSEYDKDGPGNSERTQCEERRTFVHMVLDA